MVVVSGDLTQRARPAQFRAARSFLLALNRPLVWVPGNHDVPLYRFWERFLAPFWMWRRAFAPNCVQGSFGSSWAIGAVNTAHGWTTKNGRIRATDLARLQREFLAAPQGVPRLLVVHHPLIRVAELGGEPPARGGAKLARVASQLGVELILGGHLHWGFFVPPSGAAPALVHTGTSASSRGRGPERGLCSLNWIDCWLDRIEITRWIWKPGYTRFTPTDTWTIPRREGS